MGQDTYTLHEPARRNFKRNRVIVGGIDEQWQMDLADMQFLKRYNDGYRYLLVCIDVFLKCAWIVPIKSKTGPALVEAFKREIKRVWRMRNRTDFGAKHCCEVCLKYFICKVL